MKGCGSGAAPESNGEAWSDESESTSDPPDGIPPEMHAAILTALPIEDTSGSMAHGHGTVVVMPDDQSSPKVRPAPASRRRRLVVRSCAGSATPATTSKWQGGSGILTSELAACRSGRSLIPASGDLCVQPFLALQLAARLLQSSF